jgi:hypothetical protein
MATIDVPESVKVWRIGKDSGNVMSWNNYTHNGGYSLFCTMNDRYLTWGKVPLGINLVFVSDASVQKTHFRLPDGQERPILSGESVALGIGGGDAFLKYSSRDAGINLVWSKSPAFEWRIFGGALGTPIQENSPVALANDNVSPAPDFLIYFDRLPGMADVGWTTSPGVWKGLLALADKHKVDIAKAAITHL